MDLRIENREKKKDEALHLIWLLLDKNSILFKKKSDSMLVCFVHYQFIQLKRTNESSNACKSIVDHCRYFKLSMSNGFDLFNFSVT